MVNLYHLPSQHSSDCNGFLQPIIAPTTFGLISANTTTVGGSVKISCPVNSELGVSCYIVSWNNTGNWVNQTVARFIDFINATAAYATLYGVLNTVAGNTVSVIIYANDTSNSWVSSIKYDFVITAGAATKIVFTAGTSQSLRNGELSKVITVQRQDQYGNPVTSGSTRISLTSSSKGGVFYSDAGKTKTTYVTIVDGSSTVSFWYKDTSNGSPTLTASTTNLTSALTKFKINR